MRILHGSNYCICMCHHLFASPSMVAAAVMGRTANGWLEWKTEQGQTLDGAKRQSVSLVGA